MYPMVTAIGLVRVVHGEVSKAPVEVTTCAGKALALPSVLGRRPRPSSPREGVRWGMWPRGER